MLFRLNEDPSYIQLCGFTRNADEPFGVNRIVGGENAEKRKTSYI